MNFKITAQLRQTLVAGDGQNYRFLTKLFTHSALLVDPDGFALAELKRRSWWKMSFVLKTNKGEYSILEKSGDYEIIHKETGKKFYTIGRLKFFHGREVAAR